MTRRILLALCAVIFSATTYAADLGTLPAKAPAPYPSPTYNWTGLGVEIYGLYGVNFGKTSTTDNLGLGLSTDLTALPHGPGLGGGFWYFYQPSPLGIIFGLRTEIAWANLQGGASTNIGANLNVNNATNYLGNVDGCLGIPLSNDGRLIGYSCGGFAFGGAKPNLQIATVQAAANDTSTGWNAALGLKYAIGNWVVGIEGDYYKLGDRQLTATLGGTPIVTSNVPYDIFVQKFTFGYKLPY